MKPPPAPGARRVDVVPVAELVPADRNPKTHDLDGIAGSLARFGYADTVVVDERTGRIVAGHGRVEALERLRERGEPAPAGVRVLKDGTWALPVLRGWASDDDASAEAYLLSSNRHAERGGWDVELLAQVVGDLAVYDETLVRAAGWDELEQHDLLAEFDEPLPPPHFPPILDRDGDHRCPSCHHEWNGECRP